MVTVKKFSADWCGPCRTLAPVIQEVKAKLPEVTFVDINVDTDQATAAEAGVRNIPLVVIYKDGVEVDRVAGVNPESVYLSKIQSA